jgi:hypothetical protein
LQKHVGLIFPVQKLKESEQAGMDKDMGESSHTNSPQNEEVEMLLPPT